MSKVVYHGTGDDIKKIDHERFNHGDNALGPGFYTTTNHKDANYYAHTSSGEHPNVMKLHVNIKNPMPANHQFTYEQLHDIIKHSGNNKPKTNARLYHSAFQDRHNPTNGVDILNSIHHDFYNGKNAHKLLQKTHEVTGFDGVIHKQSDGSEHHVSWFPHQVKSAVSGHTFEEAPNEERGLDFSRHQLPQVRLIDILNDPNLEVQQYRVNADSLKPSQGEFNYEKVADIIQGGIIKPIITSQDGYVIDGHHRWLAAHYIGGPIDTYQVQTSAEDLIDYLNQQDYSKTASIAESLVVEMTKRALHKQLESSGWKLTRSSGSHDVFKHEKSTKTIAVPRHKGDLAVGTVRQIQKDSIVEDGAPVVSIGNGAIDNKVTPKVLKPIIKRKTADASIPTTT